MKGKRTMPFFYQKKIEMETNEKKVSKRNGIRTKL